MFKALLESAEKRTYLLKLQHDIIEQGWDDVELVKGADSVAFKVALGAHHLLFTAHGEHEPASMMWQATDPQNAFWHSELEPSFGGTEEDLLNYTQAYFWDLEMMNAFTDAGFKVLECALKQGGGQDYDCVVTVWKKGFYAKGVTCAHRIDPGSTVEYTSVYKDDGVSYVVTHHNVHKLLREVTAVLQPNE